MPQEPLVMVRDLGGKFFLQRTVSCTMTFGVPYAAKIVSRASAVAAVSTLLRGMTSGNLVAMSTRVKTY